MNLLKVLIAVVLGIVLFPDKSFASAYLGGGVLNDWTDVNNWGAGDFTGGAGIVPSQAGNVGSAFGDVDFTFGEAAPVDSLYLIVGSSAGNTFTMASGQLTYTGDGLLGTTLSVATGDADIDHTGGTLIQTGGGAGFLVGHNAGADYSISGGTVDVQATSPSLSVDWTLDGTASAASSLNISGSGIVDVSAPNLHFGPQATLNVAGSGVLIWRNHTIADVFGTLSGGTFEGAPVIDPGATINASVTQVGSDVHFVEGSLADFFLKITIDRATGGLTLSNDTGIPISLQGYSITSSAGALDSSGWLSIADNYDADNGGSVDAVNTWTELTNTVTPTNQDLSEFEFGGTGAVVADGQSINLGGSAWIQYYQETGDLTFDYTLTDGTQVAGLVSFTGNGDAAFAFGDLDFDGGLLDAEDWDAFVAGYGSQLANISGAERYQLA